MPRPASGIERRIFVVGVPRSGTTLVQGLLAAHSRVASFTESHLFSQHFALLPASSIAVLSRDPKPRLRAFLAENGIRETEAIAEIEAPVRAAVPARLPLAAATRRVARRLVGVLDALARREGAPVWVEKTPRHLRYVPFLERLCAPDTGISFVHVVRDGLETVASLHTASRNWERPYDLATCVRRWNREVAFSLARRGAPNDHFLVYEQLTARPEPTLERLFAALELDWEPRVLERFAARLEDLVTPEETWKETSARSVRASATSERVLSSAEREWVERNLRRELYGRLLDHSAP